jgi:hypothetical protein
VPKRGQGCKTKGVRDLCMACGYFPASDAIPTPKRQQAVKNQPRVPQRHPMFYRNICDPSVRVWAHLNKSGLVLSPSTFSPSQFLGPHPAPSLVPNCKLGRKERTCLRRAVAFTLCSWKGIARSLEYAAPEEYLDLPGVLPWTS